MGGANFACAPAHDPVCAAARSTSVALVSVCVPACAFIYIETREYMRMRVSVQHVLQVRHWAVVHCRLTPLTLIGCTSKYSGGRATYTPTQ
jgi:hypothetical protein